MFEESGFEIYESMTKDYATKDIYDEPGGPAKHLLQVREVLDEVKAAYYEMHELMADWDADRRNAISKRFVKMLRKSTGRVRQQGTKDALKELSAAGFSLEALDLSDDDGDNGGSEVSQSVKESGEESGDPL